jgi:hypothetical protein
VKATVSYRISWWWRSGEQWLGPYPLGADTSSAIGVIHPVRQAQPELRRSG